MNTARHLTLLALAVLATLVLVAPGARGAPSTFTVNTQLFDP